MKKNFLLSVLSAIAILVCGEINAQTVKFKQVMYVDRNTGTEYQGSNDVRYVTFSNNYSSFQFTDANGKPINTTSSVYLGSWSYCNQYFSVQHLGPGTHIATPTGRHYNPRIFNYQGIKNGVKEYLNRRSSCNMNTNKVVGYINDYIYFSEDMSRFNIYSGGAENANGIYDNNARSIDMGGYSGNYIYVYEKVETSSNPIFY